MFFCCVCFFFFEEKNLEFSENLKQNKQMEIDNNVSTNNVDRNEYWLMICHDSKGFFIEINRIKVKCVSEFFLNTLIYIQTNSFFCVHFHSDSILFTQLYFLWLEGGPFTGWLIFFSQQQTKKSSRSRFFRICFWFVVLFIW